MDIQEIDDLKARLAAHRDAITEELKQQPDDGDLQDLLDEVEAALDLLETEDGQADLGQLEELDERVAARLEA